MIDDAEEEGMNNRYLSGENVAPNIDSIILLSDLYYNLGNVQSASGINDKAYASLSYSQRLRFYFLKEKPKTSNQLSVANASMLH